MDERVDRQLRVIGKAAQRKLSSSSVLLIGLGGLGVEIAKDIILTGFKKVGIYDDKITSFYDLGTQFFLKESDVGVKTRVQACIDELKTLNEYCEIVDETRSALDENLVKKYNVVITTEDHISEQINLNNLCRKHGVHFISSECRGVFAGIFVDFGSEFICNDSNGEKEASGIVSGIEIKDDGTCIISTFDVDNVARQNLSDGDVLRFYDIKGIPELHKAEKKITRIDAFTFDIGKLQDKSSKYESGGRYIQVKQPKKIPFSPLEEYFSKGKRKQPEYLLYDWSKFSSPSQIHLGFETLAKFKEVQNRLPGPYSKEDAKLFLEIASQILQQIQSSTMIDETILTNLSYTSRGNLNPMVTFVGGLVALEAQKAVTGKFHPIHQFFYYECTSLLPDSKTISEFTPEAITSEFCQSGRYESQMIVFGKSFQERLAQMKLFLVGCGALGCEFVKNFAMTGMCCGSEKGKLTITDMDEIETSNLSRQFLFRDEHVGQMKSECAARAGLGMNGGLTVLPLRDRVGPSTEETAFPDVFWEGLDGVVTALDNIQARKYVDSQCVFFRKPMFESGTLGTKCHTQVIIPNVSDIYSSEEDPEANTFPECSIHVHPNVIQHTISWAKRFFSQKFLAAGREAQLYLSNPSLYLAEKGSNSMMIESLFEVLVRDRPKNFLPDCVGWARQKFEELFHLGILGILGKHPRDERTETGAMFWTGTKRCPSPIVACDLSDEMTREFIFSVARLRARFYGLPIPEELTSELFEKIQQACQQPVPTGPSQTEGGQPDLMEEEEEVEGENDEEEQMREEIEKRRILVEGWVSELKSQTEDLKSSLRLETMEFEKDDPLHLSFITAASNLRARCYGIPEIDSYETKGIAGSIVPAMITTTAIATGLMMLEVLQYVGQDRRDLTDFSNGFLNIGIPLILLNRPKAAPKKIMGGRYGVWDRCVVRKSKDVSLKEFMGYIEMNYGVKVNSVAYQQFPVFLPGVSDTSEAYLSTPLGQIIERLRGERISQKRKFLRFIVSVEHEGIVLDEFMPVAYTISRRMAKKKFKKRKKKVTGKKIIKT